MTTYTATTTEAIALADGTMRAIVSRVTPMPSQKEWLSQKDINECGGVEVHNDSGWLQLYHKYAGQMHQGVQHPKNSPLTCIKLPYPPGTIIAVRETWRIRSWDCEGWVQIGYKDGEVLNLQYGLYEDENKDEQLYLSLGDYLESINCEMDDNGIYRNFTLPWRSPVTMPRSAVRTHLVAGETVCVRVQDVTEAVAKQYGFPCTNYPDFDNRLQSHSIGLELHIVNKFGQSMWDNNEYIFITQIEKK